MTILPSHSLAHSLLRSVVHLVHTKTILDLFQLPCRENLICLPHQTRNSPKAGASRTAAKPDLGHYFQQHMEILSNRGKKGTFHKSFLNENFSMASHWLWAWHALHPDPTEEEQFGLNIETAKGVAFLSWYVGSLQWAPCLNFEGRIGETQSKENVREFEGRVFDWSLCYLKALKLYNAKQVPFFFIYGSYIPPFITAIHFSSLTADNTENSLLAKNSIYHSPQDNNF